MHAWLTPRLPPPDETRTRLCDDFDCLVSPLVFDLALKLDPASLAAGWRILHAYGSPNPPGQRPQRGRHRHEGVHGGSGCGCRQAIACIFMTFAFRD